MIRIQKHAGLLTYASPYLIPGGASVEQVNLQCLLPGQLSCRGGMADAGNVTGIPLEMYGYSIGDDSTDKVFVFTNSGEIQLVESPDV